MFGGNTSGNTMESILKLDLETRNWSKIDVKLPERMRQMIVFEHFGTIQLIENKHYIINLTDLGIQYFTQDQITYLFCKLWKLENKFILSDIVILIGKYL